MSANFDLPSSTNGALLVLSVAGFGLSVHLEETFLASFFDGLTVVTGLIWLFFLTLTIYRNMKVLEEEGDFHQDYRSEFLIWYFGIVVVVVFVLMIVGALIA
jgi:hypothetical protein